MSVSVTSQSWSVFPQPWFSDVCPCVEKEAKPGVAKISNIQNNIGTDLVHWHAKWVQNMRQHNMERVIDVIMLFIMDLGCDVRNRFSVLVCFGG